MCVHFQALEGAWRSTEFWHLSFISFMLNLPLVISVTPGNLYLLQNVDLARPRQPLPPSLLHVYASWSVMSNCLWSQNCSLTKDIIFCPWDFPGKNTRAGSHFLLQGIFPTKGLNPGLLHCRQILSHLSSMSGCIFSSLEMFLSLGFSIFQLIYWNLFVLLQKELDKRLRNEFSYTSLSLFSLSKLHYLWISVSYTNTPKILV